MKSAGKWKELEKACIMSEVTVAQKFKGGN